MLNRCQAQCSVNISKFMSKYMSSSVMVGITWSNVFFFTLGCVMWLEMTCSIERGTHVENMSAAQELLIVDIQIGHVCQNKRNIMTSGKLKGGHWGAWTHTSLHSCLHTSIHLSIYPSTNPCMHACMYACRYFLQTLIAKFCFGPGGASTRPQYCTDQVEFLAQILTCDHPKS